MRAVNEQTGRVNQKLRTRMAIVEACREVIRSGGPVTMPAVARAALVSEPTAYRYFPDLISLLNAALVGMWPSPAEALEPIAASADPVERVAFAAGYFLRRTAIATLRELDDRALRDIGIVRSQIEAAVRGFIPLSDQARIS